jgi:TPR repeat protein
MLKGNLISAEDYRVFRSETYNEISNFVSEDQRVERIKAELDRIVDLPWDFAGKQIATDVRMGITYLSGEDVRQDYVEAMKYLMPAVEQHNVYTETLLANMYENGNGVAQDYEEAERWYRLAALQGYVEAQLGLGGMYLNGPGLPRDDAEALRWFQSAAEQGHDPTQAMLGVIYEHSEREYVQAHMWYSLAAARGNERAAKDRDLLAEKMSPDQIAESQRSVAEWKPKAQP